MRHAVHLFLLGVALVVLPAATCTTARTPRPAPRVVSTAPGSCDGFVDYADELSATSFVRAWTKQLGGGIVEIDVVFQLVNATGASFLGATATPDFTNATDLGIALVPAPLPAEFGAIAPYGSARSTAPITLQLPDVQVGELLARLASGEIPITVHADEQAEPAPGVEILAWTSMEDLMYATASNPTGGFGYPPNPDPGPGPFTPGQEFTILLVNSFSDDAVTVFDEFQPGDVFYLAEDPDGPLQNIPDAYDGVRVLDAQRVDDDDDFSTAWVATLKRTDTESLPAIYSSASFCTGKSAHIDLPIHESRLRSVDGATIPPEQSDTRPQGIRFNDLSFADGLVKVSGQVGGHILRPSLALRIRDGHVVTETAFDTDVSMSAEVVVEGDVAFTPEDLTLWTLCFPLAQLSAGPVVIPINLQFEHTVGLEADASAGVVVGFQKHFESGFYLRCESGNGMTSGCTSEGDRADTPLQITPPRLTDDTHAHARVETTLAGALRVGSAYPVCDQGASAYLTTTGWGSLDVEPTQDPWWGIDYGIEAVAGIELEVLGIDLAHWESDLFTRTDDGGDSGVGGERTSGEDQRWAVAIDDTSVPNGVNAAKIAALADGSSVAIASEQIGGRTPIVKLDRYGALQWVQEFGQPLGAAKLPKRVRALPDGSVVVVGANTWLARVGADGSLLFGFDGELANPDFTLGRCTLNDVVPIETAPGVYDFIAVGRLGTSLITEYDACAIRVNADGTLAWTRRYVGTRAQTFFAATLGSDGDVVAVGNDYWSYVGNRLVPLIAKLDAETGDVIWWKSLSVTRISTLHGVVEGADGAIYALGNAQGIITQNGAAIVIRMEPDGSGARHALLFQDESWEAELDFETWTDTAGGDTQYDTFFDIVPSGDGFVIAGFTGLGTATAGRAAKINPKLGIEWIHTFDGASTDALSGVAAAPDGLFVSGYSASLPERDGGTGETQLVVMKLPFTGSIELLPGVDMTTRFVAPAVRDSTSDPRVNPFSDSTTLDPAFTASELLVLSTSSSPALLSPASPYCVEKLTESGRESLLDACPEP